MSKIPKADVNKKTLIERISTDCGYLEYEVRDVLDSLSRVLLETLVNKESVLIEGIGTLDVKPSKLKKYLDQNTREIVTTLTLPKVYIRPSQTIEKRFNTDEFKAAKAEVEKQNPST